MNALPDRIPRPTGRGFSAGRPLALALAVALTAATGVPAAAQECPTFRPDAGTDAIGHVRYLADDALEGREVASPGARCAARYLASHFEDLGLEPAGEAGDWFQGFPVRTGSELAGPAVLEISPAQGEDGKAWRPAADAWRPYGFAGSGAVSAPLVYAGSGVAAPGRDEAALPEVGERIAVVEAETPGAGGVYRDPRFKAAVAAGRGAAALLVLLSDSAELPTVSEDLRSGVEIPVAAVGPAAAEELRAAAREARAARLEVRVEPTVEEGRNVAALLPGVDPDHARELVIVGAHYDHLGWGGDGSLDPDEREIHNGADDNASGTAALLEIAEDLAAGPRPGRSVLFVAFSGEERGLLGSSHFVAHPTVPLGRAVAMVNLDMVGRLRDGRLTVYGIGTAREWEAVLARANRGPRPLDLSFVPDGFGPSDHSSFYAAEIPVLHFFTNTHAEYHRPEDDWPTVNGEGIERIVELAAGVVRELAGTPEAEALALTPIPGDRANPHAGVAPGSDAPGRGYGPYLGTVPDMSGRADGVRITAVRDDSPAERAGLQGGDVIVAFGGRDVGDLYALTWALRAHAPGDTVEVVVRREGERRTFRAVLEERR